jgi:Domain of unknown function (DUF4430)
LIRRSFVLTGALLLAFVLAAPALGARVHVRVEGATATIFGPTEPWVTPVRGTFAPPAGPAVTVNADTPLGALERASRLAEFYYRTEAFSFGPYVAQIGRNAAGGANGWVYKVNGVSPPVGADKHELKAGDRVLWYFASFGPSGGPKTLRLVREPAERVDCIREPCPQPRRCYRAKAESDNGALTDARPATFRIDGRFVRSRFGRICPRPGWRSLRATKAGHVRSQVLVGPSRR